MIPPDTIVLTRREAWLALGGLVLLALLGIGAFLQHYLLVHSLRMQQDALITQVKETQSMLADHAARATRENTELRARLDALETSLRTPPAAHVREPKAKAAPAASPKPASTKTRARR